MPHFTVFPLRGSSPSARMSLVQGEVFETMKQAYKLLRASDRALIFWAHMSFVLLMSTSLLGFSSTVNITFGTAMSMSHPIH